MGAGLSDAQCADLVCVTEQTWWNWRQGVRAMPCGAWKLFRYELAMTSEAGREVKRAVFGGYQPGWRDPRDGLQQQRYDPRLPAPYGTKKV